MYCVGFELRRLSWLRGVEWCLADCFLLCPCACVCVCLEHRVHSLPSASRNSITCAAWRSPMIAFGMSDGCIAVRNLLTKETLVRYMSVLVQDLFAPLAHGYGSNSVVSNGLANSGPGLSLSVTDHAVSQSSSGSLIVTPHGSDASVHQAHGLTKVEFLKSSGPICRLLTLCAGAVAVWEPCKVSCCGFAQNSLDCYDSSCFSIQNYPLHLARELKFHY